MWTSNLRARRLQTVIPVLLLAGHFSPRWSEQLAYSRLIRITSWSVIFITYAGETAAITGVAAPHSWNVYVAEMATVVALGGVLGVFSADIVTSARMARSDHEDGGNGQPKEGPDAGD